jgi:hypothetical protein
VSVVDDGRIISDKLGIAESFNAYFTSIAAKLQNDIPQTNIDPISYVEHQVNSFVFLPTSGTEVNFVIKAIKKKKSNLYDIPVFVYNYVSDLVSPIIADLINCSVESGTYPDCLKVARVIPIHKSGPKQSVGNYRPISTLHFINKIFAKIMHSKLLSYLDSYDVLSKNQFGFRKGKSTCDAILELTDAAYNVINNSQFMLTVFLDFSRAFDTVEHSILLRKLSTLGVRGLCLEWFSSYLTNRKQFVLHAGASSELKPVDVGVPQSSVLGPLLFLVYITDMSRCSDGLQFVHFADDTTVFVRGDDLELLYDDMNRELACVDVWLRANKLSLNLGKTSYMVFSNRQKNINRQIAIRNVSVHLVTSARFLGVIVDDRLSFEEHTKYVMGKVSRSIGIMYKLSAFLPRHILKILYMSLVYPYLNYGVVVWGGANKTQIDKLCRLQNRCIKLFSDDVPIVQCFISNRLLSFPFIYRYFIDLKFYQYYVLGKSNYFHNNILNEQVAHNHVTRFKTNNNLNYPKPNKSKFMSSFIYQSITTWNDLPINIRDSASLCMYKKNLKEYFVQS